MPNTALERPSLRTRSPLGASRRSDAFRAGHSPFSSPTLHRHDDPWKGTDTTCFSTYGTGSVPATSPATLGLSPRAGGGADGQRSAAAAAAAPMSHSPELLSPTTPSLRLLLPNTLGRLARRLSGLVPASPATASDSMERSSASTTDAPDAAAATPTVSPRAPRILFSGSGAAARVATPPPSVGVAPRSPGSGATTITTATAAPRAPPAVQRRWANTVREPFQEHPPAIPQRLHHSSNASTTTSPSASVTRPPTTPRLSAPPASATTPSGVVRRSSQLSNSLRSSADRISVQLHSNRSCSSAVAAMRGGASRRSSPDSPEEEAALRLKTRFFRAAPHTGEFVPLIDWLLQRGERGELSGMAAAAAAPSPSPAPAKEPANSGGSSSGSAEVSQATFFNQSYITRLCAAATAALEAEPSLLELEVLAHDTLVVVGDIHGQFQDLYTSVLCQQYDRRRCNPDGRDRRFLFMGDYVDRGPHSLEVVLLLLALKVEYPMLVYLTRGNHEEEKTSRVYGFLTEATSSLGAEAGAAVWSAVNKVFLDLPLAAIVQTPYMRFFVTHGGLSPGFQNVEEISAVERRNYSCGNVTAAQDDMITGLLWSDPTRDVAMYKRNPRGCGFLFGPSASYSFCADNNFDFICRAHQVAMEGYVWAHSDRVVTVFSAPNYCGVNGNKGAVLVVKGRARRPIIKQYDSVEAVEPAPQPRTDFAYAAMFV